MNTRIWPPVQHRLRGGRDRGEVLSFALRVLSEISGAELSTLSSDSCLERDLELESVDLIELQVALEEEFDVELDPLVILELDRLDEIVNYVLVGEVPRDSDSQCPGTEPSNR